MSDNQNRSLAAPAIHKDNFRALKECNTLEQAFASKEFMDRIAAAAPAHVKPARLLSTFMRAPTKAPLLMQAGVRNFVGVCLTCSQVGLEANTPLQQAHMIPFKTKVWDPVTRKRDKEVVEINLIFGYPGLLELCFRSKLVRAVHADVVWSGDEFEFEYGSNTHLKHVPKGAKREANATPIYAYMHAQLADGQAFEVMPYNEVLRIRDRSQGFRHALSSKEDAKSKGWREPAAWTEAPWVRDEVAMARKTAFRAGWKWLPRSVELANAVALDEALDRRSMDFGAVLDAPTIDGTPDYLGTAAEVAQQDDGGDEPPVEEPRKTQVRTVPPDPHPRAVAPKHEPQRAQRTHAHAQRTEAPPAYDEPPPPTEDSYSSGINFADGPAESTTAFEQVLLDAVGEQISDEITDPVQWAHVFLIEWESAMPPDRAPLIENNEVALEAARTFPEAARMLDVVSLDPAAAEAGLTDTIPIPSERGKPAWLLFQSQLLAGIREQSVTTIDAWALAQKENIAQMPRAQKMAVIKGFNKCFTAFNIEAPAWFADLVESPPKQPSLISADDINPDEAFAERVLDAIAAATPHGTAAIQATATPEVKSKMGILKAENRRIFNRVDEAYVNALAIAKRTEGNAP